MTDTTITIIPNDQAMNFLLQSNCYNTVDGLREYRFSLHCLTLIVRARLCGIRDGLADYLIYSIEIEDKSCPTGPGAQIERAS